MKKIEPMINEFTYECSQTRRCLERLPEDKWDFKPHPKSMTLQQLAGHIAEIPQWVGATCQMDVLDFATMEYKPFLPVTVAELLAHFDAEVARAKDIMAEETDEHLLQTWAMKRGDTVLMSMPRIAVLRAFIFSHLIHHRGQLTVYLRMNDVPLPAIYGPSADESGMK